jgi:SAM-dependent methyltransferase
MDTSNEVTDNGGTPNLSRFREVLRDRHGFLRDVIDRSAATFGATWINECEETLGKLFPGPEEIASAAKGYALFVLRLLRAQKKFEKDRVYEAKSYAQAADEVYFDDEYMMSEYLPALLLSHYLWPHHYRQARFFGSAFVSEMQLRDSPHFTEVGIGTGLYSRLVLQRIQSARGFGFDISPSSAAFAQRHMQAFELQDRYHVVLQDVLAEPMPACEWLICVEVLEHLEDPVTFLKALRDALTPGGRAFITAALNAPHVDHIYLYEEPEEVLDHLRSAGFALEQSFVGAAYKPSVQDLPVPTVAAYILT